ncbi:MAG: hypothetical protein ABI744_08325 [Chloroflexota bacterium]
MMAPTAAIGDEPLVSDVDEQFGQRERGMRIVELLVAGVALLASLLLSIPR